MARAVFPDVIARLQQHFEVESNQEDRIFSAAELAEKLHDKDGVIATASERISAELLQASPRLKAVCNQAVGYNNIDVVAATGRSDGDYAGCVKTTADFGWAC